MPLFSVITANFNSADKLARTADSVLKQAVDLEYIIMDGGSHDQSLTDARFLAEGHPGRVIVYSRPDAGVYDAMNKGIDVAKGRYVYFIGAGDTLLPDVLRQVATLLPAHDRGFVYGDVAWGGGVRYDGPFTLGKFVRKNICHQAIFYGRDVFDAVGLYDLKYKKSGDWEFNLRVFAARLIPRIYIPVIVANFELGGISQQVDEELEGDQQRLLRQHLGWFRYRLIVIGRLIERIWARVRNRVGGGPST